MIFSYSMTDDVEFHFQAPDEKEASDLVSWLTDAPVRARSLETRDKGAWSDIYRRTFDGPREVMETIQRIRESLFDLKQEESEADSEVRRLFKEGAKHDVISPIARQRVSIRKAILEQEQMTRRMTRYLSHMLSKESSSFPGYHVDLLKIESTVSGEDGTFARKTPVQQFIEAVDKASDILGNIPGASQEVCLAYALLDGQRYRQYDIIPDADVEIQREWINWLLELVEMAYKKSFPLESSDSDTVTELPAKKLARPVSVGELRSVFSKRPPQVIDERFAITANDGPAKPYF